jgi:glutamine synthetase
MRSYFSTYTQPNQGFRSTNAKKVVETSGDRGYDEQGGQEEPAKSRSNLATAIQTNASRRVRNAGQEQEVLRDRSHDDAREYPMNATTPTFSGNTAGESAKEWLFTLEMNMRASRIRTESRRGGRLLAQNGLARV